MGLFTRDVSVVEGATTERKIKVGGPMQSGGKDRRDNLRKLHDHTTMYLDYSVYFEIICFVIVSLSLARDNFNKVNVSAMHFVNKVKFMDFIYFSSEFIP